MLVSSSAAAVAMYRLNERAYNLLAKEIQRLAPGDLEAVRRDIVLRRLNRFRVQTGEPVTFGELKEAIEDIFPEFDDRVLKQAIRANRQQRPLKLLGGALMGSAIAAGSLWFLNLPYPMIRWPVSKAAPIVLLPSFMGMDHHYRQAISLVEQADQLVNQATSAEDIRLGAEKVQMAQKHLDKLPVWFLGYYPSAYCTLFSCTWAFTYDEFESARKEIGRMEAKVFQETNAQTALAEGSAAVEAAKQKYQSAATTEEKMAALTAWQAGMDKLNEVAPETLAGRQSLTKLEAYQRDFSQVSGLLAGGNRTTTLIDAAKQFAWTASVEAQNPPHPPETWARIAGLWEQAIARLEQVPPEDVGYNEAQKLLAEYQNKLGVVQEKQIQEARSLDALESAQQTNIQLSSQVSDLDINAYNSYLQSMLNDLAKVEPGTTAYESAQQLTKTIQSRLKQP